MGTVTDQQGNPLLDAEVYLRQSQSLAFTDTNGKFVFENITDGKYDIVVFALEYMVYEKEIQFNKNLELDIQLEPLQAEQLSEVILTQEREKVFALQKLKTVEGTAIYAGKKSEVVLVGNIPGNLAANNPRQIYSQVV
ncbi:MAG: carboxypeptidase-like regulatory domain-containing protein, partial [Bacteroidota bacterium]